MAHFTSRATTRRSPTSRVSWATARATARSIASASSAEVREPTRRIDDYGARWVSGDDRVGDVGSGRPRAARSVRWREEAFDSYLLHSDVLGRTQRRHRREKVEPSPILREAHGNDGHE